MIDKIQFSIKISICIINMLICLLFFNIKCLNLEDSNLSKEFIFQMDTKNKLILLHSLFMLLYSVVFIIIYPEVNGNDILKDLFINIFYIILIFNMFYNSYKMYESVKNEETAFPLLVFDIPNYHLDKIIYLYHIIQGLFFYLFY